MKNYSAVEDPKDICTKEYVDRLPLLRYDPQSLTDAQKQQARENIGIKGEIYKKTFAQSDWSGDTDEYSITIPAETHGHGAEFCADVWTLRDGAYSKCSGYPSTGWTLEVDTTGNLTLRVPNADARFAGKLVVV